ncbi:MAG: hypothetical protein AAF927_00415 [Bacteroidota bacterium]
MKQIFTLIFLCCSLSFLEGQNNLFVPFGQTTEQVKNFLYAKEYVTAVQEDDSLHSVRAYLDKNKHVEYAFENGALYATTVTRNYAEKRAAATVQKNCMEYMQVISRGSVSITTNENVTCYTAITDSRIIKLFVRLHKKGSTLTLTAVSRHYGPMVLDDNFHYEVELLQEKFISN